MTEPPTPRTKVLVAFAAIYLIWGSTYLGIRFAIETLPPFLMAGVRFLLAGGLLYGWAVARGARSPTAREWRATTIVGSLLLLGGNGALSWAEQRVPSGVAALLVAVVPCWIVLLDWLRPGGERPHGKVVVGLLLGLAGLFLLIGPGAILGAGRVDLVGGAVLMLGSLSWAIGSLFARYLKLPSSLIATGMEMLAGGALLCFAAILTGEPGRLVLGQVALRSVLALGYLVVVGAIVGYSAYVWLLRVVPPAQVSTYAYVNPLVAVFLGWALAGEPLTARMLLAAAVIVGGVALITLARPRRRMAAPHPRALSSGVGAGTG